MRQQIGDVTLIHGDCLDVLPRLAMGSVNMVFADLPYGITRGHWDLPISLHDFWQNLLPCCVKNAAFTLTATQPFATKLISSKLDSFRYDLIYEKSAPTGFLNSKRMPLRAHEHVLVFYDRCPTYNAQKIPRTKPYGAKKSTRKTSVYGAINSYTSPPVVNVRFPTSVLHFKSIKKQERLHPTQKPVGLVEWLIRTYTNDGDTILDPVAGSGTTAIAAMRVGNRKVICIEKDGGYYDAMVKRVAAENAMVTI